MSDLRFTTSELPISEQPLSALPFDTEINGGQSALEVRAARLGAALGRFVLMIQSQGRLAQRKLNVVTEEASANLNQAADSVKVRADEVKQVATNKAGELWREAEIRTAQMRQRAIHQLRSARHKAQELQRDKPEQVVLGAGAAGIMIGIGLRI